MEPSKIERISDKLHYARLSLRASDREHFDAEPLQLTATILKLAHDTNTWARYDKPDAVCKLDLTALRLGKRRRGLPARALAKDKDAVRSRGCGH